MKPTVIVILSAPRSGSSALSALLSSLGFYFGDPTILKPASSFNKYGFYESLELMDINEQIIFESHGAESRFILKTMNFEDDEVEQGLKYRIWTTAQSLDSKTKLSKGLIDRMRNFSQQFIGIPSAIAWKDARFSVTLPVWEQYANFIPIILWRNPSQVANSIENMMQIPAMIGENLWALYTYSAFKVTQRYRRRLIINQSKLRDNPLKIAEDIVDFSNEIGLHIVHENKEKAAKQIHPDEFNFIEPETTLYNKSLNNFVEWLLSGNFKHVQQPEINRLLNPFLPILPAILYLNDRCCNLECNFRLANEQLNRVRQIPGYQKISSLLKKVGI